MGGKTPLEYGRLPVLRSLAHRGTTGRAAVIPPGLPPGSDVGNMSILGYDPAQFHTGRAPIEAAALGLRLRPDQVAFRCNLVTLGPDGTMVDFAGGHPENEAAAKLVQALDEALGTDELSFHPGVQYRHCLVAPADWADATTVPPHDLTDQPAVWPAGPAGERLTALMEASADVLADSGLDATHIWLWGQGHQPTMRRFVDQHGCTGGMVTAVDLVRGLGILTEMEVVEVEGATAHYDTNYEGKRDAALAALADGVDLFVIHVEATDEAGHAGDVTEKVQALENWDQRILADLVGGLDELGPWRMLLLPDHATPLRLRTHTSDPVPYLIVDSQHDGPGGTYTEPGVASQPVVVGHELVGRMLAG
ncbi:MAG: 2,3-bisphosphoglycerate-independent phosphoglycerate mutase [Acidimicrobiales bacterium]